jgi:hypothetical protein
MPLDECSEGISAEDNDDSVDHRRKVLEILEMLNFPSVKALISSRPHADDIGEAFGKWTQIIVEAKESDLKEFLRNKIGQSRRIIAIVDEQLKEEIISTLTENSKGM